MLRSAVSDYIDRIVDGRGPRQRVITQPRPIAEVLGLEGERHKPSYRSVIPYVQLSR